YSSSERCSVTRTTPMPTSRPCARRSSGRRLKGRHQLPTSRWAEVGASPVSVRFARARSGLLLALARELLELFLAHARLGLLAFAFALQLGAHELALSLGPGRHGVSFRMSGPRYGSTLWIQAHGHITRAEPGISIQGSGLAPEGRPVRGPSGTLAAEGAGKAG